MSTNLFSPAEFEKFSAGIQKLWNIDLQSYAERQLHRRLKAMMTRHGARNLLQLLRIIEGDSELSETLKDQFTINVSECFRDPHVFTRLERMLKPGGELQDTTRIWSAGCSYGAEPYSLAILMDECAPEGKWRIYATDIDDGALARARQGIFAEHDLRQVTAPRRQTYFHRTPDGQYQIDAKLKRRIQFSKLDLLNPQGKQPSKCDLILCRNVVIYFTGPAKADVHQLLVDSLRTDGVLLIGATERVAQASNLGLKSASPFFYTKIGV